MTVITNIEALRVLAQKRVPRMGGSTHLRGLPMRNLILGLLAFALPGSVCAEAYLSRDKVKPGEPQGCISGTIGRVKSPQYDKTRDGLQIAIQEASFEGTRKGRSSIEFLYDPPAHEHNEYNDDSSFGKVFTMCLKPGDYYFTHITISTFGGTTFNRKPFRIPFKVEAARNTYVGSISLVYDLSMANSATATNCTRLRPSHYVQISDKSRRDIPLIMASKSHPPSVPLVYVWEPEATNPLVTRCPNEG